MSDYTPGSDLLAGQKYQQGLTQDERQSAAFNALHKIYGDVAGDPEDALKMQEYGQNETMNPIKVQQANANLAGTGLDNAGKTESNYLATQIDPLKVQAAGQEITSNQQNIDQAAKMNPLKVTAAQQENDFNALANPMKLTGLGLQNQGQTDQNAALEQKTQFAAQDQPLDLQQKRATIGLTGAQTTHMNAETQLTHAQTQKVLSEVGVAGLKAGVAGGKIAPGSAALAVIQQRNSTVVPAIEQAKALIPRMAPLGILRDFNAKHNPGSPEAQYNKLMEGVKANLSMNDLQALRMSGTTLGRTTNTEFQAAANALGATDVTLDHNLLLGNLQRIQQFSRDIAEGGAATPGVKGGMPQKTFTEGQTYTDANGAKAVYKGGKFVEVK